MKNKFEQFYFENDKNYTADVYWDLYDKNHIEAIKKYDGHMFCPLCKLAPLTVAKGNQRRYFKVIESDMEKHDIECSYRYKKATKKETYNFYKDLDATDIRNRLVSCLNKMLKKVIKTNAESVFMQSGKKSKNNFFDFKGNSGNNIYLPHKNFNSKNLEEEIDLQKIYYGKCALYIYKYVLENETDIKMYYLKVLNQNSKKQICDIMSTEKKKRHRKVAFIFFKPLARKQSYEVAEKARSAGFRVYDISISPYVYNYLSSELADIPEDKNKALNYYLCFSGILEKNKYSFRCKLKDSRLMVLEKE